MPVENASWLQFIDLCHSDYAENNLDTLLGFFLTPEERDNLAARVEIISALLAGDKPQRQISQETGVSIAKITRGSNELKRADAELVAFLKAFLLEKRACRD